MPPFPTGYTTWNHSKQTSRLRGHDVRRQSVGSMQVIPHAAAPRDGFRHLGEGPRSVVSDPGPTNTLWRQTTASTIFTKGRVSCTGNAQIRPEITCWYMFGSGQGDFKSFEAPERYWWVSLPSAGGTTIYITRFAAHES